LTKPKTLFLEFFYLKKIQEEILVIDTTKVVIRIQTIRQNREYSNSGIFFMAFEYSAV